MRWTAPGSILLAGEYHATEEGGLGIALAAGGRARLLREDCISSGNPHGRELLNSVCTVLSKRPEYSSISVDTSMFYSKDGLKWGLGSSAAAALLMTRTLMDSSDREVLQNALMAHRHFQGGRGSGYDVYTSAHGGAGLFRGGISPTWEKIRWPEEIGGCFLRGSSPVSSPVAVDLYTRWAGQFKEQAGKLRTRMTHTLIEFLHYLDTQGNSDRVFSLLGEYGRLGIQLGEAIGVPARPHLPHELGQDILEGTRAGTAVKCVGAGNELTLLLYRTGSILKKEMAVLDILVDQGKAGFFHLEEEGLNCEESF